VIAIFLFATLVWSAGLTVIGYLVWRLLESLGVRGPLVAVLCGIAAVYGVGLLWAPSSIPGLVELPRILLAIAGGIVGLL